MDDRALLEAAAKAAGIAVLRSRLDDPLQRDMLIERRPERQPCGWNPLTDDGDAFRLMVELRLCVDCGGIVPKRGEVYVGGEDGYLAHEPCGTDPTAATRRVIVRAAAAIGAAT